MKIEGQRDKKEKHKEENMNNNFLLISLEEKKAKKIAEAINNDTSRKILDALAKKEYTESELSKALNIPISTIHYNLKQLMEANLVIVDEFHYSSKGKEVNHYKLANKYIILAPKSDDDGKFMEALKKIIPLSAFTAIGGALLIGYRFIQMKGMNSGVPDEAATRMMTTEADTSIAMKSAEFTMQTAEVARPLLQSEMITWFFIGALSITLTYFLYELIRKK
ncbi:MAG TPA: winged helix-turn-helix domain-containing protein [Alphaproteobacteria bacterium]|nr:winged helix-turn-helix domain-containing protein [Alphaproteobacteria bacterium]